MTWRIWSPVGSTSSSNASFETNFSSDAASALDEEQQRRRALTAWPALLVFAQRGSDQTSHADAPPRPFRATRRIPGELAAAIPTLIAMAIASASTLRRRDEGDRLRVYLDQSTLSELVKPAHRPLFDLLRDGVAAGSLICPASSEHYDETALAPPNLYPQLEALSRELSMGVRFHEADYIAAAEISAAAAAFLGEPRHEPMWREAFREDPETARPFMRGVADNAPVLDFPSDLLQREVEHEKTKAPPVSDAYAAAREAGYTFAEQVEREFEEVIYWRLGPLTDPERFAAQKITRARDVIQELAAGGLALMSPETALSKSSALGIREARLESLLRRYPALESRVAEFGASPELRAMPALRYPALLHAAAAMTRGRKFDGNDLYDFGHLTNGLSRCDLVTADSGMVQLCRDFGLIPEGVELYGARQLDALEARVCERLAGAESASD